MVVLRCEGGYYFVAKNCSLRTLWQYFQYQSTPSPLNHSNVSLIAPLGVSSALHEWLSLHPPIDLQALSTPTMQFIQSNNLQGPDGMLITTTTSSSSLMGQEVVLQHECAVLTQAHGFNRVFRENINEIQLGGTETTGDYSSGSSMSSPQQLHQENTTFISSGSSSSSSSNDSSDTGDRHLPAAACGAAPQPALPSPKPQDGYPLLVGHRTQQAAHEWSSCVVWLLLTI